MGDESLAVSGLVKTRDLMSITIATAATLTTPPALFLLTALVSSDPQARLSRTRSLFFPMQLLHASTPSFIFFGVLGCVLLCHFDRPGTFYIKDIGLGITAPHRLLNAGIISNLFFLRGQSCGAV